MDAEALFDDLAAELEPRGALVGAMFGARSLKLGSKVFATTKNGRVTVKLGAGTAPHTNALKVGEPFDPSGKGRPMKDWVTFDATLPEDIVAGFVVAALDRAKEVA
ncbi:MAG: hypothetical protein ABIN55_12965 [Aeromicrobium sp.]